MKKEEKEWAVGMLVIGVILGIVGSLAANFLDRQFIQYGVAYDIFVAVAFVFVFRWADKKFTKLVGKSN